MSNLVVKRSGVDQKYDERKLYASIYASMISVATPQKEAELVSNEVVTLTKRWIGDKTHISSHELRLEVSRLLKDYNHLAAYMYSKHRIMS